MKTTFLKNAILATALVTSGMVSGVQSAQSFELCAAPCMEPPPPTVHPPKPPKKGGKNDKYGAAAVGLLGGLVLGTMIANSGKKQSGASAIELHIAWCEGKYKTYDPYSNMFMSKHGPKYCKSPYSPYL